MASRPLSDWERETIIRFDESRAPASVFTYNRRWQQHIEKKLGIKPICKNTKGGREYEVPKSRVSMPRAPRKYSEATLTRMRAAGRALARQQSSKQTAESKPTESQAK